MKIGQKILQSLAFFLNTVFQAIGIVQIRPELLGFAQTAPGHPHVAAHGQGALDQVRTQRHVHAGREVAGKLIAGEVRVGQPVRISLDAYPQRAFTGKVRFLAPAAELVDKIKVFKIEIALDELNDAQREAVCAPDGP
ncbi:MAG: hypothetical protein AAB425_08870, partial [Bdellovibrionota bacterium]